MLRLIGSLLLLLALMVIPLAHAQMTIHSLQSSDLKVEPETSMPIPPAQSDYWLAKQAIATLRRLQEDVIVYKSMNDFVAGQKLVRVPPEVFDRELSQVTIEVEAILPQVSDRALASALENALDSFRDGAFWWHRFPSDQRVISATALAFASETTTASDLSLLASAPYTVAIHWRQAVNYLNRAEKLMKRAGGQENV